MRSFARSTLTVALVAVATLVLLPATGQAATGKPRCAATVRAETGVNDPTTIALRCTGTVLHVQLASPALHGTVDRVSAKRQTVRYRPAKDWSSHDGAKSADEFALIAENRKGADRITVRVTVNADAPACADVRSRLARTRTSYVALRCSGLATDPTFRIVTAPRHGTARIAQSTGRVTYVSRTKTPRADRFRYRATNEGGSSRVHTVQLLAPKRAAKAAAVRGTGDADAAAPVCQDAEASTHYVTAVTIALPCTGTDMTVEVTGAPAHGTVGAVTDAGVTYTPALGYDRRLGDEEITFTATNAGGSASATVAVDVRPYQFVAFGDSVTAGFGYFGDGTYMDFTNLLSCKPTDPTVNGRCSSNSALNAGATGTPAYTSDFGLANNVSWAAQFANSLQGGELSAQAGMYANYAITGSSPGDWLGLPTDPATPASYPKGSNALKPTLDKILAGQPELVAFTIGANPILSMMMSAPFGTGDWYDCHSNMKWDSTIGCLSPRVVNQVALGAHLEALYNYLLDHTTSTTFVAMPYHLTVPGLSSAGWGWWQLEGGIDLLNQTMDRAVASVRAARPQDAKRLLHVEAAFDPNATADPTKLPRFNYGGASTRLDPPSCVPGPGCATGSVNDYGWNNTFDCHWYTSNVDGPSHQSSTSQLLNANSSTCAGDPWIISSDTGIHPNTDGYARFAGALENFATANALVPALPDPPKSR